MHLSATCAICLRSSVSLGGFVLGPQVEVTTPETPVPEKSVKPDSASRARTPSGRSADESSEDSEQVEDLGAVDVLFEQSEEIADSVEPEVITEELVVESSRSGEAPRSRAEPVKVVTLEDEAQGNAVLGEVLSRQEGIRVRQRGGLGSRAEFSLGGGTAEQTRVFVDGLPFSMAGVGFDLNNAPVNLLDRVEVHRGIVPARLGADALAGAVELHTRPLKPGFHGGASHQLGSFRTNRSTADVGFRHDKHGWYLRASGFFDDAENDYTVTGEVADPQGRLESTEVYRFHDGYRAGGGRFSLGIDDTKWADKFSATFFTGGLHKEVQSNPMMTVPYGEVEYRKFNIGVRSEWSKTFAKSWSLRALAGYGRERSEFTDLATCTYDWYGRCVIETPQGGEIGERPIDQTVDDDQAHLRLQLDKRFKYQRIGLALAPSLFHRTGDDRVLEDGDYDPLNAARRSFSFVSGIDYEIATDDRSVENTFFVKDYLHFAGASEVLPNGRPRDISVRQHAIGLGDGVGLAVTPWLHFNLGYEWALRLPTAHERFGDGVLVIENLRIEPERSHNMLGGFTLDWQNTRAGQFNARLFGMARWTQQLIVLLPAGQFASHQNLLASRSISLDTSASWSSPLNIAHVEVSATWQNLRNTAEEGPFADYHGDRIPNRPHLFGYAAGWVQWSSRGQVQDRYRVSWRTRYVHPFFRSWESIGASDSKQEIPAQWLHNLEFLYQLYGETTRFSASLELQNLFDRPAYDYFGVQKPGRSGWAKLTFEF